MKTRCDSCSSSAMLKIECWVGKKLFLILFVIFFIFVAFALFVRALQSVCMLLSWKARATHWSLVLPANERAELNRLLSVHFFFSPVDSFIQSIFNIAFVKECVIFGANIIFFQTLFGSYQKNSLVDWTLLWFGWKNYARLMHALNECCKLSWKTEKYAKRQKREIESRVNIWIEPRRVIVSVSEVEKEGSVQSVNGWVNVKKKLIAENQTFKICSENWSKKRDLCNAP